MSAAREELGAICTTGELRVRAGPALDAEIIGFLRSGVRLNGVSRRGGWIEIAYRGEAGWISADYVRDDCGGRVAVVSAAREELGAICTTGELRVRAGPALDAEIIGFLRSGVRLNGVSRRGGWIEIAYRGEAGWISADYVSVDCR